MTDFSATCSINSCSASVIHFLQVVMEGLAHEACGRMSFRAWRAGAPPAAHLFSGCGTSVIHFLQTWQSSPRGKQTRGEHSFSNCSTSIMHSLRFRAEGSMLRAGRAEDTLSVAST